MTACRTARAIPRPSAARSASSATAAWMLGDENWVHLVQRRVSYGCWEYIAVRKAETPKLKPVYRIIQSLAASSAKEKRGRSGRAHRDGQARPARRHDASRLASTELPSPNQLTGRTSLSAPHRKDHSR